MPLATTMDLDVRAYMAATIGGDGSNPQQMLCTEDASGHVTHVCVMGVRDKPSGEVAIYYDTSSGIVDHIGVTTWLHGHPSGPNSQEYIGVIRNYTGNHGYLRCFATWLSGPQLCNSLPNEFYMPEGVPFHFTNLPVLDASAVTDASNPDGSPSKPIAGALLITDLSSEGNYYSFAQQRQTGSSCGQYDGNGPYQTKVFAAYVKNIKFGGTPSLGGIQTQDAFVVDTFAIGTPNHSERYFYVKGYGRVREGSADWSGTCECYGPTGKNVDHSDVRNYDSSYMLVGSANPEPNCPQGSAQKLWDYAPLR